MRAVLRANPRPSDGRCGFGRPMESILQFGSGGRNPGGRSVADDAGGHYSAGNCYCNHACYVAGVTR
jgi:hypothetical protein